LPKLLDDAIYEVTPKGDIVWQWLPGDHLDEFGFTLSELALVRKSAEQGYLHLNNMGGRAEPLVPRRRLALCQSARWGSQRRIIIVVGERPSPQPGGEAARSQLGWAVAARSEALFTTFACQRPDRSLTCQRSRNCRISCPCAANAASR